MKKLITILFLFLLQNSFATTYYVSTTGSNDANNGTSPSTPWETLAKVNSFSFSPGDNILFNRGSGWTGTLTISNSGTSGNPITFGAYGIGANPVITGLQGVGSWTNLGSNIWESTSAVSTLPYTNMVVINGVNTPMGRYPNTGYLTYQSHSGYTSLTSSSLTGTPNWATAWVVVKRNRYNITVDSITAQAAGTLTFTNKSGMTSGLNDGFGFFIQNDLRTLDIANEWYYNPTTQKIDVYSTISPTNVQISTVQNLLTFSGNRSYITIGNIDFVGANTSAIYISSTGSNVIIQNCNISYTGSDAISLNYQSHALIQNNTVSYANGNGIQIKGNCLAPTLLNNTVLSTSVFPGMYLIGYAYGGISCTVDSCLIQYNNVDSSGYNGIIGGGVNMKIRNNFINHSCLVKDDGGGIYISGSSPGVDSHGKELTGNIVLNTQSDLTGTAFPNDPMGMGIYLDSYSHGVLVKGNTASGCWASGGFFSDLDSNTIRDNTFFNNSTFPTGFSSKAEVMIQYICCNTVLNNKFYNNTMVSKLPSKYALFYYTVSDSASIRNFGTADSNYYAKPASASPIYTQIVSTTASRTLAQWQGFGFDANSNYQNISDTSKLKFVYNPNQSNQTFSLGALYTDTKGNLYNGTITLQPYTSAILTYSGSIIPPVITSGGSITLYGNFKLVN